MTMLRATLICVLAGLVAAPAAVADSRVTAQIGGPSTVQRGAGAFFPVTVRNTGKQTLGPGSPRLTVDLDSIPSSGAALGVPVFAGGSGAWSCSGSSCRLASGSTLPAGASASFVFPAQIFATTTLDLDVTGNEVSFSNARKSVRTSGTLLPVVYGLAVPANVSPRIGPIGFTLSERANVTVEFERISTRWRLRKRVDGRIVRSQRCSDRRPRVRRTTLVRRGATRCSLGIFKLTVASGHRGANTLDLAPLRALKPDQRYRLRLTPKTRDGREGKLARSLVFRTTR